ncbi:MAG TPA: M48 family metalloprotease, partial [Gammaproteobacteria bacterium]|nr:M48 family metalloprotease [Gammaproteobacteria bacterium]
AHALAEHVREQLSEVQLRRPRLAYRTVADAAHDMNDDLGLYLSLMPLSRMQELEADRIGLRLAARAGFPPRAALDFYAKLARDEDSQRRSLLATHPDEHRRDRLVRAWVGPASRIYRASLAGAPPPVYHFR